MMIILPTESSICDQLQFNGLFLCATTTFFALYPTFIFSAFRGGEAAVAVRDLAAKDIHKKRTADYPESF